MIPRRTQLMLACIALAVASLIVVGFGAIVLRAPSHLASQTYDARPTTGPYSNDELHQARSNLAMLTATPPETFSDLQIQQAAELERKIDQERRKSWEQRKDAAVHQAQQRRPAGWMLILLGCLLSLAFSLAAWKLRPRSRPPTAALL